MLTFVKFAAGVIKQTAAALNSIQSRAGSEPAWKVLGIQAAGATLTA